MGIDACIYVKTNDGKEPELCDSLPSGCSIVAADEYAVDGATHEIEQTWRYYGIGNERGNWPKISELLKTLNTCKNVETVWYFGDTIGGDTPLTIEQIIELDEHYMKEGSTNRG